MMLIAADELKKRFPEDEIIVISDPDAYKEEETKDYSFSFRDSTCLYGRKYKLIQHRYGRLDRKGDAGRLYRECNRIVDVSGYTFGTNWGYLPNLLAAYRARRAHLRRIPIYYMPQSFGPFSFRGPVGKLTHHFMQKWLSKAEVLYVREEDGMEAMGRHFHLSNLALSTDLVLQNKGIEPSNVYTEEGMAELPKQLLTPPLPNSVAILPNDRNLRFGDPVKVMRLYERLVQELLYLGRTVYLIHHAREDARSCEAIKAAFADNDKVILIPDDFTPYSYGEYVKHFDYIIASRYHGVVHAYKQKVPCIVLGWAVKYTELLSRFHQSGFAMDIRGDATPDEAVRMLLRMEKTFTEQKETISLTLMEVQRENAFDVLGFSPSVDMISGDIGKAARAGLCCSCGICAGACPVGAISFCKKGGEMVPRVDDEKCIHCGLCSRICPGMKQVYSENGAGGKRICLSVQSKDEDTLEKATSGGFITDSVRKLLQSGRFDAAFLARGYDYEKRLKTQLILPGEDLNGTHKSRYIPVGQEDAIRYILENPGKRVIYVGVPCAIHGLLNVLREKKMGRDNLLLIGLFCDMSMNYSLSEYVGQLYQSDKKMTALHFRDKRAGGYPGNMRIEFADGSYKHISAKERMALKDFCRMERCLYCLDKLNSMADFSVGDNYTGKDAFKGGSCSLILRSQLAQDLWEEELQELFIYSVADYEAIQISQKLPLREVQIRNNGAFASKHNGYLVEEGLPEDLRSIYGREEKMISSGNIRKDVKRLTKLKSELMLGQKGDYAQIRKKQFGKKLGIYVKGLRQRLKRGR